jgi:hypothetical protein
MGVALTAGAFISEKQQGILDRNLVAGNRILYSLTGEFNF